jgi:hypothetical protein
MPKIDLTGQRFGLLIALKESGQNKWRCVTWLCRCDCGSEVIVPSGNLRTGNSHSCGCQKGGVTHRHSRVGSLTYQSWDAMLQRCTNPNTINYKTYGARGITVCERWRKFENFLADMGERTAGLTLDRINNDQGYSPSNCRWATRAEQDKNKSKHRRSSKSALAAAESA